MTMLFQANLRHSTWATCSKDLNLGHVLVVCAAVTAALHLVCMHPVYVTYALSLAFPTL